MRAFVPCSCGLEPHASMHPRALPFFTRFERHVEAAATAFEQKQRWGVWSETGSRLRIRLHVSNRLAIHFPHNIPTPNAGFSRRALGSHLRHDDTFGVVQTQAPRQVW